jgi:hypothetical protein
VQIWGIPEKPEASEVDVGMVRACLAHLPSDLPCTLRSKPDMDSQIAYMSQPQYLHGCVTSLPRRVQEYLINFLLKKKYDQSSGKNTTPKSKRGRIASNRTTLKVEEYLKKHPDFDLEAKLAACDHKREVHKLAYQLLDLVLEGAVATKDEKRTIRRLLYQRWKSQNLGAHEKLPFCARIK